LPSCLHACDNDGLWSRRSAVGRQTENDRHLLWPYLDSPDECANDLSPSGPVCVLKPKRTSVRAPWQNGIAERWMGGCRRERCWTT
jgi:hypothetical protein